MKILIVDDEESILDSVAFSLGFALKDENCRTITATTGAEAVQKYQQMRPDLIILDVMLPDESGIEVCKKIRAMGSEPILFLSAKDQLEDKVLGLNTGGDDYLPKPFDTRELLARIRVALKFRHAQTAAEESAAADAASRSGTLSWGSLVLDEKGRKVTYGGQEIVLTNREFLMLRILLENRDIVLSRDTLLDRVCGYDYIGETNIVDVYIRHLRTKIDEAFGVRMIQTVRGAGYVIRGE